MERARDDANGSQRGLTFTESLTIALGLNRVTPYADRLTATSNLRFGMVLALIVIMLEVLMLRNSLSMARNPDVIAKVGWEWIIHHRIAYCVQLLSSLVFVAIFLLERHRRHAGQDLPLIAIKLVVAQFIVISLGFGIYISLGDLTRGNGLYAFLTQVTSVVCIFVVRPVAFGPLLLGSFMFMMHAADQAGALSHGTSINLQMLCLILMVSSCIKYFRHMRDATWREQLINLSYRDMLTGLGNPRAFHRDMRDRRGQEVLLVMLDLDNFKLYNDVHGHDAGNQALSLLSSILLTELGGTASLYRMGGDEFVAVAAADARDDTLTRVERSRETLQHRSTQYGLVAEGHAMSFSMGAVVGAVGSADEVGTLLHRADMAMYEEKQSRHARRT